MHKLLSALVSASLLFVVSSGAQTASAPQSPAAETASTASLHGLVTDPSGAFVSGAEVALQATAVGGPNQTGITGQEGRYVITNIAPGTYTLRITAAGFAVFESRPIRFAANRAQTFDVRLKLETLQVQVSVSPDSAEATDPDRNGDALLLQGRAIEVLPDDPSQLQQELQELSGGDT